MAGRGACAALLALAAVFTLLARGTVAGDATYNPCDPLPDYLKGELMTIGIAFWPGGRIEDWKNLSPCKDITTLQAAGVQVAVYQVKVDTLTGLTTSATVVSGLESMAFAANRQYVSAVAFRGIYVTDPVYVDVLQTNPDATVSGRGVVNSLSFNVRLEYGRIVAMQFLEQNCDRCGGSSSVLCVGRFACSTAISDCKSSSYLSSSSPNRYKCKTYFHIGFTGWDRRWQVMETGAINRTLEGRLAADAVYLALEDKYRQQAASAPAMPTPTPTPTPKPTPTPSPTPTHTPTPTPSPTP